MWSVANNDYRAIFVMLTNLSLHRFPLTSRIFVRLCVYRDVRVSKLRNQATSTPCYLGGLRHSCIAKRTHL